MQLIPAFNFERVTAQFIETRYRPDIRGDAEVLHQQSAAARTSRRIVPDPMSCARILPWPTDIQEVHAAQDALFDAGRHRRMRVVLVHAGDVIENIFLLTDHASQTILHDDGQLISIGRIVGTTVRHRRRSDQAVTVLVLQALARKRRAPCGAANQEAA